MTHKQYGFWRRMFYMRYTKAEKLEINRLKALMYKSQAYVDHLGMLRGLIKEDNSDKNLFDKASKAYKIDALNYYEYSKKVIMYSQPRFRLW